MNRSSQNSVPAIVVVLGVLVAIIPAIFLQQPSGPTGFLVLLLKALAATVGLSIIIIGVYSHRSNNPRLAMATLFSVVGLVSLGALARTYNESNMSFIPVWVWGILVVVILISSAKLSSLIIGSGRYH